MLIVFGVEGQAEYTQVTSTRPTQNPAKGVTLVTLSTSTTRKSMRPSHDSKFTNVMVGVFVKCIIV